MGDTDDLAVLTIRVPKDLHKKIKKVADSEKMSMNRLCIRELVQLVNSYDFASFDPRKALLNLPYQKAGELAEANGYTLRVVKLDGKPTVITMDLDPSRVNVEVIEGVVVEVTKLG